MSVLLMDDHDDFKDKYYCPHCEGEVRDNEKQCPRCQLIFRNEYESPIPPPSPSSEQEKSSQFLCVNCWAFREVDENGHCIKCGSSSILDREKCSKL